MDVIYQFISPKILVILKVFFGLFWYLDFFWSEFTFQLLMPVTIFNMAQKHSKGAGGPTTELTCNLGLYHCVCPLSPQAHSLHTMASGWARQHLFPEKKQWRWFLLNQSKGRYSVPPLHRHWILTYPNGFGASSPQEPQVCFHSSLHTSVPFLAQIVLFVTFPWVYCFNFPVLIQHRSSICIWNRMYN